MKRLIHWIRRHNEFTFVVFLIILIWYAAPPLLRLIDPQAGEFGVEMLYIPLIAGIFFFVGLLLIWAYLKLVFPKGFTLLDDLFENSEKLTIWQKSQLVLRLFGWLVVLFAMSLLAVTGMSAIM
jgi:hypothetical protein